MKTIRIPVITRTQDNQDGGFTTYAYNTAEELIADHPKSEDGELSEDEKQAILNEEDGYENGYIGKDEIVIEIDDKGKARLKEPLSFHAGQ